MLRVTPSKKPIHDMKSKHSAPVRKAGRKDRVVGDGVTEWARE